MIPIKIRRALAVTLAITTGSVVALLILLRVLGLVGVYSIPSDSMAPAVPKGDCVFTERISLSFHAPARGDIIAFRTDNVDPEHGGQIYLKRVIGLPGETLRIVDGKLNVDGKPVAISNRAGEIDFSQKMDESFPAFPNLADGNSYTVPQGSYFVIGDNLPHSSDSRYFGAVPLKDITARVVFCFWPPAEMRVPK
jgi:signal peptidase I